VRAKYEDRDTNGTIRALLRELLAQLPAETDGLGP
jgi:hypothetical protein